MLLVDSRFNLDDLPPNSFIRQLPAESRDKAAERLAAMLTVITDSLNCMACWAPGPGRANVLVGEEVSGVVRPFLCCEYHADKVMEALGGEIALRQWEAHKRAHGGT